MKLNKVRILLILILLLSVILRLYKIDKNPVSLFGDELDVGYQAYSILKTGRDYSGNFMPIHFRSLAEWRTPLYIYSSVPTVALFGISPLGVRLPAAIFGILSVFVIYLLAKELTEKKDIGLIAALLLAISPWHLQYSRTGFEVTEMIFLFILGIYFFLRGLNSPKRLAWSAISLGFTPWVYSTAKLFLPLIVLVIIITWKDNLRKMSLKRLIITGAIFSLITIPFAINTIFEGGSQRIQDISIFSDPTIISQMGFDRVNDASVRDDQQASIIGRLFHNKLTTYPKVFTGNYLQAFSLQFLFINGDYLNLRQSSGVEFYKIELIFLILGFVFMVTSGMDKKNKLFLILWLLMAPIPSSLTQGGGSHATRLILMLPIFILLIAFGIYYGYVNFNKKFKVLFVTFVSACLLISFVFYQHDYWVHYPRESERWWHAGYEDAVKSAVAMSRNFDRVIISSADEPSLKFFVAWSMYSPSSFQEQYQQYLSKKNTGLTLKLDKYEFPPVGVSLNLYEMGSKLPEKSLYLATAKEINLNLIKEPGRMPKDLVLVKSIQYPSGEPAFYLFRKNEK